MGRRASAFLEGPRRVEREHWLRRWGVLIPETLVVSSTLFQDSMNLPSDIQKRPKSDS